jgi:hypothetical protein
MNYARERAEERTVGLLTGAALAATAAIGVAGYFGMKGFIAAAGAIADRNAEAECIQWAAEASRHTPYSEHNPGGYYLTQWQKEECDSVNIHVNAPVL